MEEVIETPNKVTFSKPKKTLPIVSFVCAILGFIPAWGFIFGITAIVLGITARLKKHELTKLSNAAIIIGIISIIAQPFIIILYFQDPSTQIDLKDYVNSVGNEKSSKYFTISKPFIPVDSAGDVNSIRMEITNGARENLTLIDFSISISSPSGAKCEVNNLNNTLFVSGETKIFEVSSCTGMKYGNNIVGSMKLRYLVPGSSIPLETEGTFSLTLKII